MSTMPTTTAKSRSFSMLQSIAAGCMGMVAVIVLSIGTDEVLHRLEVYPPWGQPMHDTSDNLLALAYRSVYGVLGSYIAARLAPHSPMQHALALGYIGLVLSSIGVIVAINMNLGPIWYPIGIVITALPGAWLGGVLHRKWHAQ